MKVQAALLTPDEVEKLARAAALLAEAAEANAKQWTPSKEKVDQARDLLADVLKAT